MENRRGNRWHTNALPGMASFYAALRPKRSSGLGFRDKGLGFKFGVKGWFRLSS